jgi:hypothetical protein
MRDSRTGLDPEEMYEVMSREFETNFSGRCNVDRTHVIKPGDMVARIQRTDNPLLVVSGVCCPKCLKILPRAR